MIRHLMPRRADELGDQEDEVIFFFAFLSDDDGSVGEELEGPAGGGSSVPLVSAMAVSGMGSVE